MGMLTIAKREFRSYFDSPVAYVVICIGLVALGFVFFMFNGGFWQANRATLQQMFVQLPRGLSWLVIPVITMRSLAEEKHSGTLEMLVPRTHATGLEIGVVMETRGSSRGRRVDGLRWSDRDGRRGDAPSGRRGEWRGRRPPGQECQERGRGW